VPFPQNLNSNTRYSNLPDSFYRRVKPQPLNNPYLVSFSPVMAELLDIDAKKLKTTEFIEIFSGNRHRHGFNTPDHQSLRKAHPDVKLVIYGHTHQQVIDDSSTPWVANPGAAGATRTNGGPSYMLLTASEQDWTIESIRLDGCA